MPNANVFPCNRSYPWMIRIFCFSFSLSFFGIFLCFLWLNTKSPRIVQTNLKPKNSLSWPCPFLLNQNSEIILVEITICSGNVSHCDDVNSFHAIVFWFVMHWMAFVHLIKVISNRQDYSFYSRSKLANRYDAVQAKTDIWVSGGMKK